MFTLYRIAFASPRKQYLIGLMFTNKNGCGGAISVTERSYAAPIFKVESHISRIGVHTILDGCSGLHGMPSGDIE